MDPVQFLWPAVVILVALIGARRLSTDLRPIFLNIVNGVAKSAGANAPAYGIALLFGLSASLSAFIDVFHTVTRENLAALSWHQYFALRAKVLNPFVVAILAYATQNKFKSPGSSTSPPFPPPP